MWSHLLLSFQCTNWLNSPWDTFPNEQGTASRPAPPVLLLLGRRNSQEETLYTHYVHHIHLLSCTRINSHHLQAAKSQIWLNLLSVPCNTAVKAVSAVSAYVCSKWWSTVIFHHHLLAAASRVGGLLWHPPPMPLYLLFGENFHDQCDWVIPQTEQHQCCSLRY